MFRVMLGVLLLMASAIGQAEESSKVAMFEMNVRGGIEIGPEGRITAHSLRGKVSPFVRDLIAKQLQQWQFQPVEIDGRPVIAKTKLRLALSAELQGEDRYRLTIRDVWFGEPERAHRMSPPEYPAEALRAGIGAKVVLVLKLDGEGKVLDAFARQTSLTHSGREKIVQGWRKRFEDVSLRAAKRWRFVPGEQVNGVAVEAYVAVPVVFSMAGSQVKGWSAYVPGPINPAPWPEDGARLADTSGLEDGDMMPLDSRFKLKNDVIGTVL